MNKKPGHTNSQVIALVEGERQRIGETLHDSICQTLAGTNLLLESVGLAVAAEKPVSRDTFEALKGVLDTAIAQARLLARRFNPLDLSGPGLLAALDELARQIPGAEFICERPISLTDPDQALALYRICEQALEAATHARAQHLRLRLEAQNNHSVLLTLTHDGSIPKNALPRSATLMHVRAEAVGATLSMETDPSGATTVRCEVRPPSPNSRKRS